MKKKCVYCGEMVETIKGDDHTVCLYCIIENKISYIRRHKNCVTIVNSWVIN